MASHSDGKSIFLALERWQFVEDRHVARHSDGKSVFLHWNGGNLLRTCGQPLALERLQFVEDRHVAIQTENHFL